MPQKLGPSSAGMHCYSSSVEKNTNKKGQRQGGRKEKRGFPTRIMSRPGVHTNTKSLDGTEPTAADSATPKKAEEASDTKRMVDSASGQAEDLN